MIGLVGEVWPAMALAAGLGFAFELFGGRRARTRASRITGWLCLLALAVGAVLAAAEFVSGRPGLWLDLALLVFGSYAAGTLAVVAGRALAGRAAEPERVVPAQRAKPLMASTSAAGSAAVPRGSPAEGVPESAAARESLAGAAPAHFSEPIQAGGLVGPAGELAVAAAPVLASAETARPAPRSVAAESDTMSSAAVRSTASEVASAESAIDAEVLALVYPDRPTRPPAAEPDGNGFKPAHERPAD